MLIGETRRIRRILRPTATFSIIKSHTDWFGIEPGSSRCKDVNYLYHDKAKSCPLFLTINKAVMSPNIRRTDLRTG